MTYTELHQILDDENKKLTPSELKQVIYDLKQDCFHAQRDLKADSWEHPYYSGEQNAFQIALDLLEHLGEERC